MEIRLTLVETADEAADFIQWIREPREVIGVDTETSGLDWTKHRLRLIQFGDYESAYAIPWDRWNGVAREAIQILERSPVVVALHNQLFDNAFLAKTGASIKPERRICTLTMSHLYNPIISHGLKPLAKRFVPGLDYAETELLSKMTENKWTWETVPVDLPEYWKYGAVDAIITARLWKKFNDEITDEKTRQLLDIEMASQCALEHMGLTGMQLDLKHTIELDKQLRKHISDVRFWVKESYGIEVSSKNQVISRLTLDGWEPSQFTDKGNIILDASVLTEISNEYPLARAYKDMKHSEKLQSTFTSKFLAMRDSDNIIHPKFKPNGARTGRMSMEKPNLQQIPTMTSIRSCLRAREDHSLIFADYDAIELRMFARYTGDSDLIAASSADDPHYATSKLIWPDDDPYESLTFPGDTVVKTRRNLAKALTYTMLYGAGAKTFSETSGLPNDAATIVVEEYHEAFPAIREFTGDLVNTALDVGDGMVETMTYTGRKQRSYANEPHKLVNYVIQGTSADVLKRALARIWQSDIADTVRLAVHDELIFECPDQDAEEVRREVECLMTDDEMVPVLSVSSSVGKAWKNK